MQVLTHTRPYKDLKDLSENHINEGARILPTELLPPDSTGYAHLEETWETGEEGARREGEGKGGMLRRKGAARTAGHASVGQGCPRARYLF